MSRSRFAALIAVLVLIAISALVVRQRRPADTGTRGGVKNPNALIIAELADITTLDPASAYDTLSAGQIQNIYDTLIRFDGASTTEFVPSLATEWTVSPDGKTYRFHIRQGVRFHNGNSLTPEDVEYSFERGMVQDYSAGPQWMFFEPLFGLGTYTSRTTNGLIPLEDIKSKIEIDGEWIQFNLATPYQPFLQILASSWGSIVDKEWCVENGDWDGTQESYLALNDPEAGRSPINSKTNGTGPYILQDWKRGNQITLVRNDDYWGPPAKLEKVITLVIDEWGPRRASLESGDVDCAVVPSEDIRTISQLPGISVYDRNLTLQVNALFFQFDIDPNSTFTGSGKLDGNGIPTDFFDDVDVRKGFAYAFDWDTYIHEAMMGYAEKVSSPIPAGLTYYRADWPSYELDLSEAESHLRKAWDGQLWELGFEMSIGYTAGDNASKMACEIIANNVKRINPLFRITVQALPLPTFMNEMKKGTIPAYINSWVADYADAHNFVFPILHSNGTFARAQKYENESLDSLIERAIAAPSRTERQSLYDEVINMYHAEAPSVILAQPVNVYLMRDWVDGFEFNPMKACYSMYAYYLSKE